jgi:hypothetical protein
MATAGHGHTDTMTSTGRIVTAILIMRGIALLCVITVKLARFFGFTPFDF